MELILLHHGIANVSQALEQLDAVLTSLQFYGTYLGYYRHNDVPLRPAQSYSSYVDDAADCVSDWSDVQESGEESQ